MNGDHAALHVDQEHKEEILWIWIGMIFMHAMDMRKGIAIKDHVQVRLFTHFLFNSHYVFYNFLFSSQNWINMCKGKTLLGVVNKLLFSKVCWQHPAIFCLYTSNKLSCPFFELSLKMKVVGLNPGYLLKSFLLYLLGCIKIKIRIHEQIGSIVNTE